ncbi:hypothetical protein Tco_0030464, partial [Tanacetum coccineum]
GGGGSGSGGGSGGVEERVGESEYGDRVDPVVRSLFGFGQKSPPEKFSGGGGGRNPAGEDDRRWWLAGGGRESIVSVCVCV